MNKDTNGLAYDSIREIYQDSKGYIWIGTYKGLSRFDGIRFKNYDRDDFDVTSDFINAISEDQEGNLWIGTDNGIVIYSREIDDFMSLKKFIGIDVSVPDDRIFAIQKNSRGVMWISSKDEGLFSYDATSRKFSHHPLYSDGSVCNNIYRITIDRNDNLYLAVYCDNIYFVDSSATSISPLNIGGDSDMFKGDDVEGVVISDKSKDILYVASKRSGIVEVNIRSQSLKQLYALEKDVRPKNLIKDSDEGLWLSTTNGLVYYDIHSDRHSVYRSDPSDCFSISDSYVTVVHKDRNGGLWVGTQYGGLNYYSPYHDYFTKCYKFSDGTSMEGVIIRDFAQDRKGNLWIATERMGLLKYSEGKIEVQEGNLPKSVLALVDDGDCLWLGTQKGLYKMDYMTGRLKYYAPFETDEKDNRVVAMYNSRNRDIYVATTIGVMRYVKEYDHFEMLPQLSGITIENVQEDNMGVLWLASYSSGVYTYDIANQCILNHYSPQKGNSCIPDMISSICVDNDNNVWVIGFSSGFFCYDRSTDSFKEYSTSTLPSLQTDVFYMAFPDQYGNLWLSSDSGLLEFNSYNSNIRVFSTSSGLLDKEFTKAGIALADGNLAFGSANGFVIINPKDFQSEGTLSKVTISDMYIDFEPVDRVHKERFFSGNINSQHEINLNYEDNSFGFSFAMLDSASPTSERIFCYLEGYDTTWNDVSAIKAAHWTNVPSGRYRLYVSNGLFSGSYVNAREPLVIVVEPKFWNSPIGIIIILLITTLFLLLVIYILVKNMKVKQQRKLEDYRKQKDKELQKDKMTFFSNIIHEIKTPLTLIRTPLQKILSSNNCDQSLRDEIAVISSSTDYMNDLVKELLDFVRLEEHGYVLDLKNIDVVERTGFLCFSFSDTAKERNIKLSYTHDQDSIMMAVDKIAYRKILNNMLDNGVKYADSYLTVHMTSDEENMRIFFRNDGDEIPASRRDSIFKPFVQYSSEHSPYSQSFGIGLAHARNLAELHGGSLILSDNKDCTEFILTLPKREVVRKIEEVEDGIDTEKRSSGLPYVLIVEDNANLLTYLKRNLKHFYNVIPAQSAEKALFLLSAYKFDIILTDIALQGMSGVDLCRKINSDPEHAHIPVIVVSAISSVETKMKCMEYGAASYIEKPYSMDYLLACIKGALGKRDTLRATYGRSLPSVDSLHIINRDEDFLRRLEKVVLENIANPAFSNKQLEEMLYMGHSTLNRKIKSLLDTTPNDYIRSKRLSVAAEMLSAGGHRINEVCYSVGFNSPSYFAKCFKRTYGILPAEWVKLKAQEKTI